MSLSTAMRPAIAMIELIFAIVVMGITLLSIPMLLSTATKSSMVSFQQEAIAMAATHTNALLTYAWDEQNTDSKILYTSTILDTSNGALLLSSAGRPALTYAAQRVRLFDPATVFASPVGNIGDGNASVPDFDDDVDDFTGREMNLTLIGDVASQNEVNEGEYIDQDVRLNTTVTYGNDTASYNSGTGVFAFSSPAPAGAPTTFIKLITTQLTSISVSDDLNDKDITLRAFMCNIGAARPLTRGGF